MYHVVFQRTSSRGYTWINAFSFIRQSSRSVTRKLLYYKLSTNLHYWEISKTSCLYSFQNSHNSCLTENQTVSLRLMTKRSQRKLDRHVYLINRLHSAARMCTLITKKCGMRRSWVASLFVLLTLWRFLCAIKVNTTQNDIHFIYSLM